MNKSVEPGICLTAGIGIGMLATALMQAYFMGNDAKAYQVPSVEKVIQHERDACVESLQITVARYEEALARQETLR